MIIIVLYINFETYFHVRIVKGALYYSLQFCANDDIPPRQCAAFHCSLERTSSALEYFTTGEWIDLTVVRVYSA